MRQCLPLRFDKFTPCWKGPFKALSVSFIGGGGRKRLEKRTDGEKKESRKNRK